MCVATHVQCVALCCVCGVSCIEGVVYCVRVCWVPGVCWCVLCVVLSDMCCVLCVMCCAICVGVFVSVVYCL